MSDLKTLSETYCDFEIRPSIGSVCHDTDWCATHVDYDLDDDRIFVGPSIEAVKADIDEYWEEQGANQ